MSSSLVDVYEQACRGAVVRPNSALTRCFAASNQAMPLKVLSLTNNLIGPRGLVALLPVLRECRHTLHSVDLSHNNLGNGSIRMLVLCFANRGFAALRQLELRGNLLTYQGGKCLVHWCAGVQTVKRTNDFREAGAGEAKPRSAAAFPKAAQSDALTPSLFCIQHWCDAADVHIEYIGIEGTAMPEMLQRALQQRIAATIARRKARRLGCTSQQNSRVSASKSGLIADVSGVADTQPQSSTGTDHVKMTASEAILVVAVAHAPTRSPVEWLQDDNSEQQYCDGGSVSVAGDVEADAVTEARKADIPYVLECDTDTNVYRMLAYDDASANGSVPDAAEELDAVKDKSGRLSLSSTAFCTAGPPPTAHLHEEQQPLPRRRARSSMCPASRPEAASQQQELGQLSSPPRATSAFHVLDDWALEAVDDGMSGGGVGKGKDADDLPMWLEDP
ncbi:hypothetical protein LSCM1_04727 [Leishmania martiniquensis]|uniref:Leucine-rich repeat protein n=1 Tax=Leishmania martiniquensis TaxID=1580590 RepID=A0A836KKY9_9TRYP|nr:hypothetical protein LSCM1_04727 [Leishmania martiniquensis]